MKKIIAIALALVLCLSVMSVAAFAAPEGLNGLAVVGENIPGVGAWAPDDANGQMTEVSEGIFEKTLDCTAGTSMKLKIAGNGTWDDAWNFGSANIVLGQKADLENGGGSKDMPLTIDKDCKIKITVDVNPLANGGAATILVEEVGATTGTQPEATQPQATEPQATEPQATQPQATQPQATQPQATEPQATQPSTSTGTVTLSVKVPANWTKVYAYAWDTANNNAPIMGDWPGSEINKNGDWYKGQIKNNVTALVINNGEQTAIQTVDLQLDAGKDVWVVLADQANADGKFAATVTYTAPAAGGNTNTTKPTTPTTNNNTSNRKPADTTTQGTLSNYRVVGNAAWMGNWTADSDLGRMYDTGNGVYKKNFENVEPGSYELKITKDGKWDNAYGDANGQNYTFTVDQKGTITVSFTIKDNQGVISVYGENVVQTADISMISVIVLLVLATTATAVLVINKKKFI